MADGWSAMVIGSVIRSHFGKYFWSGHRPGRRSAKMMLDRTYDRIFVCGVVAESKNLCMKFRRRKATIHTCCQNQNYRLKDTSVSEVSSNAMHAC